MSPAVEITMADVWRDTDTVHAWLRANGLEPRDTAPGVIVRDGRITATLVERDPHGRTIPRTGPDGLVIGVVTRVVDQPLLAPVPDGIGQVTA